MNFSERDEIAVWHPFTQHQTVGLSTAIVRGEGAYLIDIEQNRLLDLISSWWVNLHGHAHPVIATAIYQQALQLEQVIFSDFTHPPAVQLAENLLALLPAAFTKIFYSDNGSTAVEVALKMAYQFWRNQGQSQKTRFISFKGGYHGDTFGAMSVGQQSGFFSHFENLLFQVETFSYPATWLNDHDIQEKEYQILTEITQYLERWGNETAALIIEPLVQGASGMHMCRVEFLQQLEKLMQRYHVLTIYDEVMTGFGRTGEHFACLKAKTTPDFICLAKGLTGGFLPLAVTACQDKIFQAFLGPDFKNALAHGHSFTANPLGCAAGLASLELLVASATQNRLQQIEKVHQEMLSWLMVQNDVARARYCGTIAAFDLKVAAQYGSSLSLTLRQKFLQRNLLIRPLGNTIYFLPPYCIEADELKKAYLLVNDVIHEVQHEVMF